MANYLFTIGINKYLNYPNLRNCINDTNRFKTVLNEKYGFEDENLLQFEDNNATYKNISEQFINFKNLTIEDSLIVYFSGHGAEDSGSWVLHDSSNSNNVISFIELQKLIEVIVCRHIVVFSDSCYSRSILDARPIILDKVPLGRTTREKDYDALKSRYFITSGSIQTTEFSSSKNSVFNDLIIDYLSIKKESIYINSLVEYIIEKSITNRLEKPQASYINDNNNQFGRFLFKISDDFIDEISNEMEFHNYSDFKSLIENLFPSHNISESIQFELKSERIGFTYVTVFDTDSDVFNYYMYYYGFNEKRNVEYLTKYHPDVVLGTKNLVILIPKLKDLKKPESRKINIATKFKAKKVEFIDEYISNKTLHKSHKVIPLLPKNFVTPLYESGDYNWKLKDWLEKEDFPILSILGDGGMGKTTLSVYLANEFSKINLVSKSIIFIECRRIRNSLNSLFDNRSQIGLYDIYEAFCNVEDIPSREKLSNTFFRSNIDHGNLLLIFDGIDELISHVTNFNVDNFLESIFENSSEFKKSKIIITCRTHFWNKNNQSTNFVKEIRVLPFFLDQVKQFFQIYFNGNDSKTKKCIKLSEDFSGKNSEEKVVYVPYMLDVIRTIVESDYKILENEIVEQSDYLTLEDKKDYVIHRACSREKEKLNELTIDNQISFFIHLAVTKKGVVDVNFLKIELESLFKKEFDNSLVESFKSHILFKRDENKLILKYDFLFDFFISKYIRGYLINRIESKEKIIEIIADNCWYNSGVLNDLVKTIDPNDDIDAIKYKILELIEIINKTEKERHIKSKNLSSLFNILLKINHKIKGNNIENNTYLLKEIFLINDEIDSLSLIDIYDEQEVKFDFSDIIFKNCFFKNYKSFWNSRYSINTYFYDCTFSGLNYKGFLKSVDLDTDNIINPNCDEDFRFFVRKNPLFQNNAEEELKNTIKDFLRIFTKSGTIVLLTDTRKKSDPSESKEQSITYKYSNLNIIIDLDKLINIGRELSLIEIFEVDTSKLNRITIKQNYKNDVLNFVNNDTPSKIISDYYREIKKIM